MVRYLSRRLLLASIVSAFAWIAFIAAGAAAPADEIRVFLDDWQVVFDQPPVVKDGRTLIPVRAVAEQMGGRVLWNEEDGSISVELKDTVIRLVVDRATAWVDNTPHFLDTAPQIIGDRTLMPIRFVAEAAGYTVKWYEDQNAVGIFSEPPKLYRLTTKDKEKIFQNNLDGYQIRIPSDWQPDMSMPQIVTSFKTEDMSLFVFRQETDQGTSAASYIRYTNKAVLSKSAYMTVTTQRVSQLNGMPCTLLAWRRAPLARVPHDQCYYYKADITQDDAVITFLFKGTEPPDKTAKRVLRSFSPILASYPKDEAGEPFFHGGARSYSEETEAYYQGCFDKDASLTWGIFDPTYKPEQSILSQTESSVNYRFPLLLIYTGVAPQYKSSTVGDILQKAWQEGRTVELTMQNATGADTMFGFDVLDGRYDQFLEEYATAIAEFSHPVLLRLFNEMNGDWCVYSAYQMGMDTELVCALYRYVAGFFERAGADNVLYVFNPNGRSLPNFKWNHAYLFYPGDEYVDIWGMTAYNTGTYYSGEKWRSFDELYRTLYDSTTRITDMPLMITEFSCARRGGDKEKWVQDMLCTIENYPAIKAAVWWNHADFDGDKIARSYYFLDSEELKEIWKNYFTSKAQEQDKER